MKIEWAPVKIPPKRRLQTLAVALYTFIFMALPFLSMLIIAGILYYGSIFWRVATLAYLTYVYYDHTRNYSVVNGNGCMFLRNNCLFRHMRDYFPIELIKTAELTPNRNYILASFPHGVIGTGISSNMGNNIGRWLKLYPGVRPKLATLDVHFWVPIMREFLRGWGLISVSKDSLRAYLTKSNNPNHPDNRDGFTSNAVAILVGGAQEALDAYPGSYVITLKNRKGFVKMAIRTGSPIVPTFSFGEVEIYDQVHSTEDSKLRRFQTLIKKLTGVSPLIVVGRGIFQYNYGLLPHRKHLVQVVGSPIEVVKSETPDPAYVNEIHQKVIDALKEMFEKYKRAYIEDGEKAELVIH